MPTTPKLSQKKLEQLKRSQRERKRESHEVLFMFAEKGAKTGPLPECTDVSLREKVLADLEAFFREIFPHIFEDPFGSVQRASIGIEQEVLESGAGNVNKLEPRGYGKALCLETRVPIPGGFTTMGEIEVGDTVYDENGEECRVTFKTPVYTPNACYRLKFDDGEEIDACSEHQWLVRDSDSSKYQFKHNNGMRVVTTQWLVDKGVFRGSSRSERRFSVPITKPVQRESADLPIDPYVLGCWLGDGHTAVGKFTTHNRDFSHFAAEFSQSGQPLSKVHQTSGEALTCTIGASNCPNSSLDMYERDVAVKEACRASEKTQREIGEDFGIHASQVSLIHRRPDSHYDRVSFRKQLEEGGLLGNKHVPSAYLMASPEQRLSLLQGLMDTDGTIASNGQQCEFCSKLETLADSVVELVLSLGMKCTKKLRIIRGRTYYRVFFKCYADCNVFRLFRKRRRVLPRPTRGAFAASKRIVSIEPIDPKPMRCIQVDSKSHVFLCGERYTATHNSTRSVVAATWGILKGVQDFPVLCSDSTTKSSNLLKLVKRELTYNDLLIDIFPELYCFKHLDNNPFRGKYQLFDDEKTNISIQGDMIRFPEMGGKFPCERSIFMIVPFRKARGLNIESKRPSVVFLDDIQSSEEARSPTSVAKNLSTLNSDIAFLGTRKRPVPIINNATIIAKNDFPHRLTKTQAFTTVRYKMVESMPKNLELWRQYQDIRQTYIHDNPDDRRRAGLEALEFYKANREAMDEGSQVTWDYAFSEAKWEISTIQAAMNFIADFGQEAFDSECQNDPKEAAADLKLLSVDEIMVKMSGVPANIVPDGCDTITAMVDVHEEILDYELWAYQSGVGGYKIAGGTWPDQGRLSFNHGKPNVPLSDIYPGLTDDARITAGLDDLWDFLLSGTYRREDSMELTVKRCLTDANGTHSDAIKKAIKASPHRNILTPSYGVGIRAKDRPISQYPEIQGMENVGPEWTWTKPKPNEINQILGVRFDSNYWKTQFHKQLAMAKGTRGCLMLYHADPEEHRLAAEGYKAETPTKVTAKGRDAYEWALIPGRHNHPLDTAVGCLVAASMEGISMRKQTEPEEEYMDLSKMAQGA